MAETKLDGFTTWNRGLMYGRTTHLNLRSDSAEDEETGLVFGAISTMKSVLKTKESEKSFKLLLILDTRLSGEEEEFNDDP